MPYQPIKSGVICPTVTPLKPNGDPIPTTQPLVAKLTSRIVVPAWLLHLSISSQ